jgi:Barstar (barnase inhibitor)
MSGSNPDIMDLGWEDIRGENAEWAMLTLGPERALDDFVLSLSDADVSARIIRGSRCADKQRTFQEWAAALQFPYYFGYNWDAFEECMGDLEWIDASAVIIFIAQAARILPDSSQDRNILFEILRSAALGRQSRRSAAWNPAAIVRFVVHAADEEELRDLAPVFAKAPLQIRALPG